MRRPVKSIYDDEREIKVLVLRSGINPEVGKRGVTRIEFFQEATGVPWFAVYVGGILKRRIPITAMSEVEYD